MDFQVINSLFLFIWQLLYSTPLLLKKNFTGYIILIWCVFVLFFSILEMSSGLCHFRYEVNHFSCHCLPVCNLYSFPLADFATCCLFLVFSNLIMMCVGMVFVCFYSLCLEFFEVLRSGSCFFFFSYYTWKNLAIISSNTFFFFILTFLFFWVFYYTYTKLLDIISRITGALSLYFSNPLTCTSLVCITFTDLPLSLLYLYYAVSNLLWTYSMDLLAPKLYFSVKTFTFF